MLLLALDYPELSDALLQRLWRSRSGHRIVLPVAGAQRHPLCGFYHREAALAGSGSVLRALEKVDVCWVPCDDLAEQLHNVNRPEDLR